MHTLTNNNSRTSHQIYNVYPIYYKYLYKASKLLKDAIQICVYPAVIDFFLFISCSRFIDEG
jgi:hypothetical protein